MRKCGFWFGVGLLLLGFGMAVFGHTTPQQIRGLAEMLIGLKLVDIAV